MAAHLKAKRERVAGSEADAHLDGTIGTGWQVQHVEPAARHGDIGRSLM